MLTLMGIFRKHWWLQYLKQPDEEHDEANGLHDARVVVHQCLLAAPPPQVQLVALLVVVVVSRAIAELLLDAGPRGKGAAAAEGNSVHQELPVHVTPKAAAEKRGHHQALWAKLNSDLLFSRAR